MRTSVYWPCVNKNISDLVGQCEICQLSQPRNQKEPLVSVEIPSTTWTKLGVDLCELNERHYLVLVDYLSKLPIMRQIDMETSPMVIHSIKCVLSKFCNIKKKISDNSPCFSFEFAIFVKSYGIVHTTISPHHHKSNGQVERCIRMIKGLIKKTFNGPWMSLLIWRSNAVDGDLRSPAELLNGHEYQSNLPLIRKTSTHTSRHKDRLVAKQAKIGDYHGGNAKELKPLYKGQDVLYELNPDNYHLFVHVYTVI